MDDARIREAYTAGMTARGSTRTGCPAPEALLQLALATRHDERSATAFDHVLACSACLPEYELLRSIHQSHRPAQHAAPRRWLPLALAASALLAVAIGTMARRANDGVRGATDDVTLIAPTTRLPRGDSLRLAWHAVTGADAYRVEVIDGSGAVLHTVTTGDTSVVLAPAVLADATTAFDWLVVARRSDGNERRSALRRVVVTP